MTRSRKHDVWHLILHTITTKINDNHNSSQNSEYTVYYVLELDKNSRCVQKYDFRSAGIGKLFNLTDACAGIRTCIQVNWNNRSIITVAVLTARRWQNSNLASKFQLGSSTLIWCTHYICNDDFVLYVMDDKMFDTSVTMLKITNLWFTLILFK